MRHPRAKLCGAQHHRERERAHHFLQHHKLPSDASSIAGTTPTPPFSQGAVAVVQSQDQRMDRTAIDAEVTANNGKLKDLGRESGNKVAQNVVAGWPAC
jgi:hypothetical protein